MFFIFLEQTALLAVGAAAIVESGNPAKIPFPLSSAPSVVPPFPSAFLQTADDNENPNNDAATAEGASPLGVPSPQDAGAAPGGGLLTDSEEEEEAAQQQQAQQQQPEDDVDPFSPREEDFWPMGRPPSPSRPRSGAVYHGSLGDIASLPQDETEAKAATPESPASPVIVEGERPEDFSWRKKRSPDEDKLIVEMATKTETRTPEQQGEGEEGAKGRKGRKSGFASFWRRLFKKKKKKESEKKLGEKLDFQAAIEGLIDKPEMSELIDCVKLVSDEEVGKAIEEACELLFGVGGRASCDPLAASALLVVTSVKAACRDKKLSECLPKGVQLPLVHHLYSRQDDNSPFGLRASGFDWSPFVSIDKNWLEADNLFVVRSVSSFYNFVRDRRLRLQQTLMEDAQNYVTPEFGGARAVEQYGMVAINTHASHPEVDPFILKVLLESFSFSECMDTSTIDVSDASGGKHQIPKQDLRKRILARLVSRTINISTSGQDTIPSYNAQVMQFYFQSFAHMREAAKNIYAPWHGDRPARTEFWEDALFGLLGIIRQTTEAFCVYFLSQKEIRHGWFIKTVKKSKRARRALSALLASLAGHGASYFEHVEEVATKARERFGEGMEESVLPQLPIHRKAIADVESMRVSLLALLASGDSQLADLYAHFFKKLLSKTLKKMEEEKEKEGKGDQEKGGGAGDQEKGGGAKEDRHRKLAKEIEEAEAHETERRLLLEGKGGARKKGETRVSLSALLGTGKTKTKTKTKTDSGPTGRGRWFRKFFKKGGGGAGQTSLLQLHGSKKKGVVTLLPSFSLVPIGRHLPAAAAAAAAAAAGGENEVYALSLLQERRHLLGKGRKRKYLNFGFISFLAILLALAGSVAAAVFCGACVVTWVLMGVVLIGVLLRVSLVHWPVARRRAAFFSPVTRI